MAPNGFEIIRVPDQDTPTTAEITSPSDTENNSKPEDSPHFKIAASPPSPTHARHHDHLFSKTGANFTDGPSSDLSSPFTDFDTTHSRSDPVPLHFTTQRADKMGRRPRLTSAEIMAMADDTEAMESYCNDHNLEMPGGIPDYIYESGINSPGSRPHYDWDNRPVGYVPAGWPTGPRDLPSGHYICPHEGCENPVGQTESDEGYSRTTLGPHILTHGEYKVRSAVRDRVRDLRYAQGLSLGDGEYSPPYYSSRITGDLHRVTDDLIRDLEELQEWEQSDRVVHGSPPDPITLANRLGRQYYWFHNEEEHEPEEVAEEADDEYVVPHQNSNRFRNNRFRREWNTFSEVRLEEEVRPPSWDGWFKSFTESFEPLTEQFKTPNLSQYLEADTDSSNGPPRKRARKFRKQLDGSLDVYVPGGGEDPMELDY